MSVSHSEEQQLWNYRTTKSTLCCLCWFTRN